MTKTSKAKLAYMANYQQQPENAAKGVERKRNRRAALREGSVHVGDGKEIDHKKMLDSGGSSAPSNLRVVPASTNRAWRAKAPGAYTKK